MLDGRKSFAIACATLRPEESLGQAKQQFPLRSGSRQDASTVSILPAPTNLSTKASTSWPAATPPSGSKSTKAVQRSYAFVALTTVGLGLAASVINLITAIIKARSEGIRKGDGPSELLEVIVRRVHAENEFREETVLRVGHRDAIDETKIEQRLTGALRKLLKDDSSPKTSTERTGPRGQRKQAKKRSRTKRKS